MIKNAITHFRNFIFLKFTIYILGIINLFLLLGLLTSDLDKLKYTHNVINKSLNQLTLDLYTLKSYSSLDSLKQHKSILPSTYQIPNYYKAALYSQIYSIVDKYALLNNAQINIEGVFIKNNLSTSLNSRFLTIPQSKDQQELIHGTEYEITLNCIAQDFQTIANLIHDIYNTMPIFSNINLVKIQYMSVLNKDLLDKFYDFQSLNLIEIEIRIKINTTKSI
ncbi:MAG: hypothetical protein AB8B67_01235 [Rickettsiaceae bacterium]